MPKAELSFLCPTFHLVLFYISTKYHTNIPKGLWLTEPTRNQWIITVKYNKGRSKRGTVVILVRNTSHPVLHFYQVPSKYSKGCSSYRADTNLFQIKQRVITPKVRRPELSILYATCHLVLIYISTKYHQNIPRSIQVTECTRLFTPTGSVPKTVCPPIHPLWRKT